jgi:hypothetical protein
MPIPFVQTLDIVPRGHAFIREELHDLP